MSTQQFGRSNQLAQRNRQFAQQNNQPTQEHSSPHSQSTFRSGNRHGVPAAAAARNLTKVYGTDDTAVHALAGVDVEFQPGQYTAIMGPSGSGKSTLMHLLAGLDSATTGQAFIGATEITKLGDKALTKLRRDRIGFVFQQFNLLPMLTAEQNITLPVELAGGKVDQSWLTTLAKTLGIEDRLQHRPAQMSGGQQQRVAIARALITRPEVVFADEPTGNLDSHASAQVLSFLRRSVREFGTTIIMVTHDAAAAAYADCVVLLADGQIAGEIVDPTPESVVAGLNSVSGIAANGTVASIAQLHCDSTDDYELAVA